jgi:hypothetical protein
MFGNCPMREEVSMDNDATIQNSKFQIQDSTFKLSA